MQVYYFAPFDVLRPRTNQISDIRFCEGLVQNDCQLTLVAPYVYRKDNLEKKKLLDFYGVENKYKIKFLPTLFFKDVDGFLNLLTIVVLNTLFFLGLLMKTIFRKDKMVIISRSPSILYPFLVIRSIFKSKLKIIAWVHEVKNRKSHTYVYQQADFLWGTNSAITNDLKKRFAISDERIGVTNNPVTERQVKGIISKQEARKRINVDKTPLIVYTGKLFVGQLEVEYILDVAKELSGYTFLLTGGKPEVIDYYKQWGKKNNMDNLLLTGYLHDYTQLMYYQQAADVLISYYTTKEHDVKYNFPQKIVEYMLTGNPIVSPDFEATQDVLDENTAIFVEPENKESLKQGIVKAVEDRTHSEKLAKNAFNRAKNFTFKKCIETLLIPIKQKH